MPCPASGDGNRKWNVKWTLKKDDQKLEKKKFQESCAPRVFADLFPTKRKAMPSLKGCFECRPEIRSDGLELSFGEHFRMLYRSEKFAGNEGSSRAPSLMARRSCLKSSW